jgi:hypothetical protein
VHVELSDSLIVEDEVVLLVTQKQETSEPWSTPIRSESVQRANEMYGDSPHGLRLGFIELQGPLSELISDTHGSVYRSSLVTKIVFRTTE